MLNLKGFNLIFDKTKFYKNRICWDLVTNENDNLIERIQEDTLESYLFPEMIDNDTVLKIRYNK